MQGMRGSTPRGPLALHTAVFSYHIMSIEFIWIQKTNQGKIKINPGDIVLNSYWKGPNRLYLGGSQSETKFIFIYSWHPLTFNSQKVIISYTDNIVK